MNTHQWAIDLVKLHAPEYKLVWKYHQRSVYGSCRFRGKTIIIHAYTELLMKQTLWATLHEIAHAKRGPVKERYRGRKSYHGPEFAQFVCDLFERYCIIDYVASEANEYLQIKLEARRRAMGAVGWQDTAAASRR